MIVLKQLADNWYTLTVLLFIFAYACVPWVMGWIFRWRLLSWHSRRLALTTKLLLRTGYVTSSAIALSGSAGVHEETMLSLTSLMAMAMRTTPDHDAPLWVLVCSIEDMRAVARLAHEQFGVEWEMV